MNVGREVGHGTAEEGRVHVEGIDFANRRDGLRRDRTAQVVVSKPHLTADGKVLRPGGGIRAAQAIVVDVQIAEASRRRYLE